MTSRVQLLPYDSVWPRRFEAERDILAAVFAGAGAVIEHVGSTAVPGLLSKPVIDVMIGVKELAAVDERIPALTAAGYGYVREYEAQLPDRRYFRKPQEGRRRFHVHCVVRGGAFWIRHLAFRDHLRAHPEVAAAYATLKEDLAARVSKAEYTQAKGPFIEQVLASVTADRPGAPEPAIGTEPGRDGTRNECRGATEVRT